MCGRCKKGLELSNFRNNNKTCNGCLIENAKYEESREYETKLAKDRERDANRREEADAFNKANKDIHMCRKCGFKGNTADYFTTKNDLVVSYCLDKCYRNRLNVEENRKGVRTRANDPIAKINSLKRDAGIRNQVWKLDDEYAEELLKKDCFYCESKPTDKQLNSIDAIKHKEGFVKGNVLTCCETCNRAKGSDKLVVFIKRARHIISIKYPDKYDWSYPKYFPDISSVNYREYARVARRDKKPFNISKNQFIDITSQQCHYCNKKSPINGRNGIDRKSSSKKIGYKLENCLPCCKTCNYLKHTCEYEEFFNKMEKVATNKYIRIPSKK
jgi:hypothetical protein